MTARRRDVVVFDIDGTLADCKHRLHHIHPKPAKSWEDFEALTPHDTPIPGMVRLIQLMHINPFTQILILTGRADRGEVRNMTIDWLERHGIKYDALIMRAEGDMRPATLVKQGRLEEMDIFPEDVITIFEDDPATVKHLRELGYHVCNVDDRVFMENEHEGGPE